MRDEQPPAGVPDRLHPLECTRCGTTMRITALIDDAGIIASIEAPPVLARILEHFGRDTESVDPANPCRAPPKGKLSC